MDPLSPNRFNALQQVVILDLHWEGKGLKINGKWYNNLRFTDDVCLVSDSIDDTQIMLNELSAESEIIGLPINRKKTEVMFKNNNVPIHLNRQKITNTSEYKYLAQTIAFTDRLRKELKSKVENGWKSY